MNSQRLVSLDPSFGHENQAELQTWARVWLLFKPYFLLCVSLPPLNEVCHSRRGWERGRVVTVHSLDDCAMTHLISTTHWETFTAKWIWILCSWIWIPFWWKETKLEHHLIWSHRSCCRPVWPYRGHKFKCWNLCILLWFLTKRQIKVRHQNIYKRSR